MLTVLGQNIDVLNSEWHYCVVGWFDYEGWEGRYYGRAHRYGFDMRSDGCWQQLLHSLPIVDVNDCGAWQCLYELWSQTIDD